MALLRGLPARTIRRGSQTACLLLSVAAERDANPVLLPIGVVAPHLQKGLLGAHNMPSHRLELQQQVASVHS